MRIRKRRPTHPGKILKYDYMDPLHLSVTQLAECLKVSRKTVSRIVNERGAVTSDMALRLSKAFQTTPALWLNLQKEYDLWCAENASKDWDEVQPVEMSGSVLA